MGAYGAEIPARRTVHMVARESTGWAIAFSLLLIVLGLAALALPLLAGVTAAAILAWLLIFGGVAHLVLAVHVRGAGAHVWEALIGVAYLVAGVYLFLHPLAGLFSLTVFLGAYLVIKGVLELVAGFTARGAKGSGWLLVDAVLSILIAVMIWTHLPFAATWAIGTLLGVAILFSGISRLAFSLSARKAHSALL